VWRWAVRVTPLWWLLLGASLEVIQKKRTEKTEVCAAAQEAALQEIKERIKKTRRTTLKLQVFRVKVKRFAGIVSVFEVGELSKLDATTDPTPLVRTPSSPAAQTGTAHSLAGRTQRPPAKRHTPTSDLQRRCPCLRSRSSCRARPGTSPWSGPCHTPGLGRIPDRHIPGPGRSPDLGQIPVDLWGSRSLP
jgi:hypothetical protein